MAVDREWILERLTGKRGEKARLADALDVLPDVVSKILSGARQLTPSEADAARRFFGEDESLTEEEAEMLAMFRKLPSDKAATAKGLLRVLADESAGLEKSGGAVAKGDEKL